MGRGACATRPRTRGMITAEAETGVARLQDQDWTWKKRCQVNPNFRLLWPKIEFLGHNGKLNPSKIESLWVKPKLSEH